MKKPPPEVIKALAVVNKQWPAVAEWLKLWREDETKQLILAQTAFQVLQGRCQILQELEKCIKEAPELDAKP